MDDNSQYQLRVDNVGASSAEPAPTTTTTTTTTSVDSTTPAPIDTTSVNTDRGATVDNSGNGTDSTALEPVENSTPVDKKMCALCKAEWIATIALRWGMVLVCIALVFSLVKGAGKAKGKA